MTSLDHLRGEEYRRLWDAARRSLELNGLQPAGRIGLTAPTDAERWAVSGITGTLRDPGVKRLSVEMGTLDAAIRRATGLPLNDLIELLTNKPLIDRTDERATKKSTQDALRAVAERSSLHERHPWFRHWTDSLDSQLTKLINSGDQRRLSQAVDVLERLEGSATARPILLAELAESATGDTKALNRGRPVAALVLRALALREDVLPPANAEQVRDLWAAANVVVDDLASRVLVLNLPAEGAGLGEWLTSAAQFGVPFQITLHQLVNLPIKPTVEVLYVCENPAILRRAAQDLGSECPPLICTEGQPSAAFHYLLRAVAEAGIRIHYHGDFDWPGLAITNALMERHGVTPWQMTSAHYERGVRVDTDHLELKGRLVHAAWDQRLTATMIETGVAIYEEAATVTAGLIADLAAPHAAMDRTESSTSNSYLPKIAGQRRSGDTSTAATSGH